VLVASVAGWLGACASTPPPEPPKPAPELAQPESSPASAMPMRGALPRDAGAFYVPDADPKLPRIRYVDGQVSPNTSCMIRLGSKLSRRIPPAYVNGVPLGFC
jgi:hypothetical protein